MDPAKMKRLVMNLQRQTDSLTKRDLKAWRAAWQVAINVESPNRQRLYDIYSDTEIDLHLSGCIEQRKGFVKCRSFKLTDKDGKTDTEATKLLNAVWFKQLMDHALDSVYWGHSLIELGEPVKREDGSMKYDGVTLIPRKHVVPEYGRFTPQPGQDWREGIEYRVAPFSNHLIEVGGERSLGLYLKLSVQAIPKRHVLAFWDTFGEIFGMPMRIGTTNTRDEKERKKMEGMLDTMGTAFWGLFAEGTDIKIVESTRGDAFNVYDKRIDRANSEMSKGTIGQTMTIENGASKSQSETHLAVFENLVEGDADMLRDVFNDQLLPKMVADGFPMAGLTFDWDYSTDFTPEQQVAYERLIGELFEYEAEYFVEKYGVKLKGPKQKEAPQKQANNFFD